MLLKSLISVSLIASIAFFAGLPVVRVVKDEYRLTRPVRAAVENLPYDAQEIEFETPDGLTLSGSYVTSKNGATIVMLHGSEANRTQLAPLGKLLVDHGYGILSYDTRSHGESEGDIVGYGEDEVLDVQGALNFLDSQEVDRSKIGGYGFSFGAFILARAAAHEKRLKSLVLASVYTSANDIAYDYSGGGVRGFIGGQVRMLTAEALGLSTYGVGILDTIPYISPRPLLLLAGGKDAIVPVERVKQVFASAGEPKNLEIFPDAGHGDYVEKNKERFERVVLDHFQKTLLTEKTDPKK